MVTAEQGTSPWQVIEWLLARIGEPIKAAKENADQDYTGGKLRGDHGSVVDPDAEVRGAYIV